MQSQPFDIKAMIADHMEAGFLENIIDMFKHDRSLFSLLSYLMADERGRVRLGTVALVEEMKKQCHKEIIEAIPFIADILKNPNPTIRADAVYLLGVICHKDCLPHLFSVQDDENTLVREAVMEAISGLI